jgi:hypothetical protein
VILCDEIGKSCNPVAFLFKSAQFECFVPDEVIGCPDTSTSKVTKAFVPNCRDQTVVTKLSESGAYYHSMLDIEPHFADSVLHAVLNCFTTTHSGQHTTSLVEPSLLAPLVPDHHLRNHTLAYTTH